MPGNEGLSGRLQWAGLLAVTALAVFLCYLLLRPFVPALTWAWAFAAVGAGWNARIAARTKSPALAALLLTALFAAVVLAPATLAFNQAVREAQPFLGIADDEVALRRWIASFETLPLVGAALKRTGVADVAVTLAPSIGSTLADRAGMVLQLVLTILTLFYFLRDGRRLPDRLRGLLPLSDVEASQLFGRIAETIAATVYGTLALAVAQGVLGGLMFRALGLPAPVLWGVVMGVLSLLPLLGAALIWAPAALALAVTGHAGKALILAAWGSVIAAAVDNFLYRRLIGGLRLHTLPVFFAVLGGIAMFGISGIIIGPVTLAVTMGLLEVWSGRALVASGRVMEKTQASAAP